MYSLKFQRRRVQIDYLNKRVSAPCIRHVPVLVLRLLLLVESLRRSKRVVSVTHSKRQHSLVLITVALIESSLRVKLLQRFKQLCLRVLVYQPARYVTAVFHHIKVIHLFKAVLFSCKRLNDALFRIVNKYHNVRQLNRRTASYLYPRRDALNNSCLRRPHLAV